jgi:hypothetical protein
MDICKTSGNAGGIAMKKIALVIVLSLIIALTACGGEISYSEYVRDLCKLNVSGSTVISSDDSHGGFHGDGALTVVFDCTQISDSVARQVENWSALPLSENLQLIMYGGTRDGVSYGYNLGERYGIPEVENGFYFFCDRQSKTTNTDDDSALFKGSSYNFSLIIYDTDSAQLYLFEYDT